MDMLGGITKVGEYYTRIELGGQKVRVQVDTGSSTLAVPVAECNRCRTSDLRYNMKLSKTGKARKISCANPMCASDKCGAFGCSYCSSSDACCSDESPAACAFFLKYGDGSFARGALMIDQLSWGDNLTTPVVFGGILYDSVEFERSLVDGILGLAYTSLACNPTCVEPPFQQMVKNGVVKDKFAICMTPHGGKLVLGDVDPSLAKGPISYVPLALSDVPTFYTVNMSNVIKVGDRDLALPNFRAGVIDSGTTLIAVTKITFTLIMEHMLQHHCDVPHLCDAYTWFRPTACIVMPDEVLAKLPSLTFRLGLHNEFDLVLQPDDYMIKAKQGRQELRCVGFMALDSLSPGTDAIFGNTIMMRYLTVYDRESKRMGFAESSKTCGAPIDCRSYTRCDECAANYEACAFNFFTGTCDSAGASDGLSALPFPRCRGAQCACSLGPRVFLIYGVSTGFAVVVLLSCVVAVLFSAVKVIRQRAQRMRPAFEVGDAGELDPRSAEPVPLVAGSSDTSAMNGER